MEQHNNNQENTNNQDSDHQECDIKIKENEITVQLIN